MSAAPAVPDQPIAVQAAAIKAMRKAATVHSVLGWRPALPAAIAVLPVPGYASMTLLLRLHDTRLNSARPLRRLCTMTGHSGDRWSREPGTHEHRPLENGFRACRLQR